MLFPQVCPPGRELARPHEWADSFHRSAAGYWKIGTENWAGPVTVVECGHHLRRRLQAAEPVGDCLAVPAGDEVIRVRQRDADEPSASIEVKPDLHLATDDIRGKTTDSPARSDPWETPRRDRPEAMEARGRRITPRTTIVDGSFGAWGLRRAAEEFRPWEFGPAYRRRTGRRRNGQS